MTQTFTIGQRIDDQPGIVSAVNVDLGAMLEDRLLIQANSGGGKSWTVRRICEQTHSMIPQIVIDPDGEYHTLRERHDYILAGQQGGDCPVSVESAELLARRLMELGSSAVIDIYELGLDRAQFVRAFFTAIMNLPKTLWRPVLFVIDEAHLWAPEEGHVVSTNAICDLMSRGRKRGYGVVLATQRIAKIHKDAISECNNVLVGRCNLDNDQKRAGKELGFTDRQTIRDLRKLSRGVFWAYGPAISDEVIKVQVGGVQTTHPKSGMRAVPPSPPRAAVKKLLAQLADLPGEAAKEAQTADELRAQLSQAKKDIAALKTAQPRAEVKTVEKPVLTEAQIKRAETTVDKLIVLRQQETVIGGDLVAMMKEIMTGISVWRSAMLKPGEIPNAHQGEHRAAFTDGSEFKASTPKVTRVPSERSALVIGMLRILAVLKRDGAMSRRSAALRALMTPEGGTFKTYMPKLIRDGYVTEPGHAMIEISAQGEGVLREDRIILCPSLGDTLVNAWAEQLVGKERDILHHLHSLYPKGATRATIAEACGMSVDGGTFKTYMPRILRKDLAVQEGTIVYLARELMP